MNCDLKLATASAMALVLVGCGGGGGSSAPTSAAPSATATPAPTPRPTPSPTPTPSDASAGATPLFAQGTGEEFLFVCETFISDRDTTLIETLIEPQTGGVLMFDDAAETYSVGFEEFNTQFRPEDFVSPSSDQGSSGFYENFSDIRDTRFRLQLFSPLETSILTQESNERLEDVEFFEYSADTDGLNPGRFLGSIRRFGCIYGLNFTPGQLPAGGRVSFNDARLFNRFRELVTWSASFDPATSEISFQVVTGQESQTNGTGSGGPNFTISVAAAFSGRAIVDPETGRFEGTITQLDDFDEPDISSSVLVGSDFTVEEGAFSGTFLGARGDQFAFSYNIRLSEDDPDSRPTVFDGAIIATSTGNQNP